MNNNEIAKKLTEVARLLEITNQEKYKFQIIAYENATHSISHATKELEKIYREEGKKGLDKIPGIGPAIAGHIIELIENGKIKKYEKLKQKTPVGVLEFMDVPGIGPKTAQRIQKELGSKTLTQLKKDITGEKVQKIFGQKERENIVRGIGIHGRQEKRMLLSKAEAIFNDIKKDLEKCPGIKKIDPGGSLRRRQETVGDIDISTAAQNPQEVVDCFSKISSVRRVLAKGENRIRVIHENGQEVDLMVLSPNQYGSLLQQGTGDKNHSVHLRKIALEMGYSLSEYGIKMTKGGTLRKFANEEDFYKFLKMDCPPPELRTDQGEIELAQKYQLPKLVELKEVKGDFHIHTTYSDGEETIEEMTKAARDMGYEFIGISDHTAGLGVTKGLDEEKFKKQWREIDMLQKKYKNIKILKGAEINLKADGSLDIDEKILKNLDFGIASIHASFFQTKAMATKRILGAMENPKVNIIGHPTGRMFGMREEIEIDWEPVFKKASQTKTALEINASPSRLDLKDVRVREAKKIGIKFAINTDAHQTRQLDLVRYGIDVARRGWATKEDILNTWPIEKILNWFKS